MATQVATGHVATDVAHQGFAVVHEALDPHQIDWLLTAVQGLSDAVMETGRGGARALFERVPEIRNLARQKSVRGAAAAALGPNCFPVRALLFDKTPAANWKVTWHQDLTIAVRARRDVEGNGVSPRVIRGRPPAGYNASDGNACQLLIGPATGAARATPREAVPPLLAGHVLCGDECHRDAVLAGLLRLQPNRGHRPPERRRGAEHPPPLEPPIDAR